MGEVKLSAELMLECSTVSLLIIEEREDNGIVIGAPHHAPKGIEYLKCKNEKGNYRVADENAGFLGRYIAEKLNSHSIIACNYYFDVNKNLRTDYSIQIAKWKPKYLIEIHGHGDDRYGVLISSGSKDDEHAISLASLLNEKKKNIKDLKDIEIVGKFIDIPEKYQAKKSVTITDDRWKSFHIEIPKSLRKTDDLTPGKPPIQGYHFCNCLVESIGIINVQ